MRYTYPQVRASYGGANAEQERHDIMFRFFARAALLTGRVARAQPWFAAEPGDIPIAHPESPRTGLDGERPPASHGEGSDDHLACPVLDAADGNMAGTLGASAHLVSGWKG